MNKNIAKIILINLIIAQTAYGMDPVPNIHLTEQQQQAFRDTIAALAAHYEQTTPKVAKASLAGGATTFLGSLLYTMRRTNLSKKSGIALSLTAGLVGTVGSHMLSSRLISQPEETRLLQEAGQRAELRAIPPENARRLADALEPVKIGGSSMLNNGVYHQATGENLPLGEEIFGCDYQHVRAAKALLTYLAQMPQEDE